MIKTCTRLFFLGLFSIAISSCSIQKKQINTANKVIVLNAMRTANSYFMNKWPDPGKPIFTNIQRPSNIWTRAVYYEGLMALYSVDKNPKYYNYAVDWSNSHQWGLRNGIKTRNGDDQACGQTYLDLYQIDKNPAHIKDIKASIDLMMASGKIDDWTWIDALQMAMPVFAKLGVEENNPAYFEYMYKMYMHTKTQEGGTGLYNAKEGLWWRDKNFLPPYQEPNGDDCYWSRGNGWVFAALVRVLEIMPKNAPHRDEYLKTYVEMAKALASLQRADGFWNVSLQDATHFGGPETSGTALFVYGMAYGLNNGLLDKATYQPVVAKGWKALSTVSLHQNGFLGYLQGTGKEPKDGQPVSYDSMPDFEDFGLGCFLLAGSEMYKLREK